MSATSPTAQLVDQDHLPPSWTVAQVDEVGRVQMGRQRSPEFQSGRFTKPYLRAANILDGRIDTTDVLSMDFDPSDFQSFKLRDRDVLIVEGGTVGRSAVYRGTIPDVCFQNTVIRFQVNERLTCPEFADYLFRHYFYRGGFKDVARQTTIAHLGLTRFAKMPFILPPLPEQRRIVEAIEANFARLEAGVAALERARMKLERYRASVLEGVWTKGGPNLTQLGTLVTEHLCNGISIKGSDAPPGTPALRLSAMGESGFDYSDVRYLPLDNETAQDLAIRAGEFFISRGNGSLHLVGRGTLAQATPQRVVYPDTMTRVRLDRARVDPRWIALIWASRGLRNQIEARVKTTAGIFKISHPQMETIEIPLPDLEVQATLIRDTSPLLDNSTKSLSEIQESLGRCKSLRQSVLKSAFEGRLVPQDPNDEPASALLERIQHEQSPPSHSMTRKRNAVRAS